MFDTHTHIQFKIFEGRVDEVVDLARHFGVSKIMVVGTDLESSKNAVNLASQFNGVYASVGIHPHHVFEYFTNSHPELVSGSKIDSGSNTSGMTDGVEDLLNHPKVLAIGETGMDKYIYKNTKYLNYLISEDFLDLQKRFFTLQIKLAIKYDKSLIVHNMEAVDETLAVLKDNWSEVLSGRSVFHCCEPDFRLLDFAKEYNIFIGVDGDVTYDRAKQKFVKLVPLELLVLETDSPFLVPKGSQSLNIPSNLRVIAEKISKIKKVEQKKIEEITFQNSLKLFGIIS